MAIESFTRARITQRKLDELGKSGPGIRSEPAPPPVGRVHLTREGRMIPHRPFDSGRGEVTAKDQELPFDQEDRDGCWSSRTRYLLQIDRIGVRYIYDPAKSFNRSALLYTATV